MSKYTIAVLVGSLRAQSYNRQLAQALAQLAGDKATFEFLEIGDLPLYNEDRDSVTRPKAPASSSNYAPPMRCCS